MIPATTSILSSRSPFRAPRFTVDQTYLTTNCTRIATDGTNVLGLIGASVVSWTIDSDLPTRVGNQATFGTVTLGDIAWGGGSNWAVCGTVGFVAASTDGGANWTQLAIPGTAATINSICFGPGNKLVCAVGNKVYTMADFTTATAWTQVANLPATTAFGLMYDSTRAVYISKSFSSPNYVLARSTDLTVAWTNIATGTAEPFAACNASYIAYTSGVSVYQGTTWTTGAAQSSLNSVILGLGASSVGMAVSAAQGYAYSTNGTSWTVMQSTGNSFGSYNKFLTGGPSSSVIYGINNTRAAITWSADGGKTWIFRTSMPGMLGTSAYATGSRALSPIVGTSTILVGGSLVPTYSTDGMLTECGVGNATLTNSNQYFMDSHVPTPSVLGTPLAWVTTLYDQTNAYNRTYTSTDQGITWTARWTSGSPKSIAHLNGVTVLGMGGVYSTTDGATWTARTTGLSASPNPIIVAGGSGFVAVNTLSATETSASTDGVTWTKTTQVGMPNTALAWTGTNYVAAGTGGAVKTSPTGVTWTTRTSGTAGTITHLAASSATPGLILAATSAADANSIQRSTDHGVTWSTVSLGLTLGTISGLYYSNGEFILAATVTSHPHLWLTSTDGATWTVRPATSPVTGASFCSFTNGIGADSTVYSAILSGSTLVFNAITGLSTGNPSVTQASALGSVIGTMGSTPLIAHNGQYYCGYASTSYYTKIYRSTDMRNWTVAASGAVGGSLATWQASSGSGMSAGGVTITSSQGNLLLAVSGTVAAAYGVFKSSDNGSTWTKTYSTASVPVMVSTTDGSVWAFPSTGGIMRSTDGGATWSSAATTAVIGSGAANVTATTVLYTGQGFILVHPGKVYSSTDGVNWTNRTFTNSTIATGGVMTNNAAVVFVNSSAPVYTYDNGVTWTAAKNAPAIATTNNAVWAGNVMYFSDGTTLLSMDM